MITNMHMSTPPHSLLIFRSPNFPRIENAESVRERPRWAVVCALGWRSPVTLLPIQCFFANERIFTLVAVFPCRPSLANIRSLCVPFFSVPFCQSRFLCVRAWASVYEILLLRYKILQLSSSTSRLIVLNPRWGPGLIRSVCDYTIQLWLARGYCD